MINSGIKAYLFGVTDYESEEFNSIPNIKVNLQLLKKVLNDSKIAGIPEENIKIYKNLTENELKNELFNISQNAKWDETVLVYFSGHGIYSDQNFKLYLSGKDTDSEKLHVNGLSIEKFKALISSAKVDRKIVILDCCYSGAIHESAMSHGLVNDLTSQINKYKGTFTISSSSQDEVSLFPYDKPEEPTYFTGKLIKYLQEGINNNKPHITIQELYSTVKADFEQAGNMPIPQASSFENASELPIAYNQAFRVVSENKDLEIKNPSLVPNNHVFIFNAQGRGATTFTGTLLKTVQHSPVAKLKLRFGADDFINSFAGNVTSKLERGEFPEKSLTKQAVEINAGVESVVYNKDIKFSFLEVSGEDTIKILNKESSGVLSFYLSAAKSIVILTSPEHAEEDDLLISSFFELMSDKEITASVELIITKWDKTDGKESLSKFTRTRMPNTSKWLDSDLFETGTYNFSIYGGDDNKTFDAKNNRFAKQFVNRLWENITGESLNIFNTGTQKKNYLTVKPEFKELYHLFVHSQMNELMQKLSLAELSQKDSFLLRTLQSDWHDIEKKERFDILNFDEALKQKSVIKNQLLEIIRKV